MLRNQTVAFKDRIFAGAVIILFFLLTVVPVSAQQSTGTILGVVKDTSSAVVPDVTITILNSETGLSRTVTTGMDGAFRAPALPVGRYDVRIEKIGFRTETQRGLILEVAQELVLNPMLEIGAVTQEIVVSGEAPLVNTTNSTLGGMVNEQRMADLPLNGRNYVDLTLNLPGVAKHTLAPTGGFGSAGTWFSANGAPVRSNNFTLDGALTVNALGAATSSEAGTTLGVGGIREYKVVTSAFSAEYGLAMGSQMIIVSKSGTNQWHGDIFEFVRNSALDARNFFDYPATSGGRRLPLFQRNNFGGSGGGPIKKDKTFFYAVYEGLRQNLGVSILDLVPPAACHQLLNPGANNTTLANPAACAPGLTSATIVPPVMQPLIDRYPLPSLPNNQFTFPSASTQRVEFGQMRVDQNFSDNNTFFTRYTIDDGALDNATGNNRAVASGTAFPGFRTQGTSRNQFLTLSENHIFTSSVLNTGRASLSRTSFGVFGVSSLTLGDPRYTFTPGQPMGSVGIGGFTGLPGQGTYSYHIQTIFTFSDDLFYTKGRHAFKFGGLFNRYNLYNRESKLLYGQLTFNTLPDFMQGIYDNYSALAPGSHLPRFWSYKTMGLYAQDDIRVNSRLTVNAGLRYEFLVIPRERYGLESRFLNFADPNQDWTSGPVMRNPSKKNFSPRVGFAWDVRGNGKTAIRSGFGLYFEVGNFGSAIDQVSLAMPPYSRQSAVGSNPERRVISLPFPFPDNSLTSLCASDLPPANCANRLQTMAYDVDQPRSLQYNFTIEQQIPFGIGLSVSYVGNRGIHLWQVKEGNPILPSYVNGVATWSPYLCNGVPSVVICPQGQQQQPNPIYRRIKPGYASVITTKTDGDSWYNSLQLHLNKRLSRGLEFQSAYTWSKALDTTQGQLYASDCADAGLLHGATPWDRRLDKGPTCYDLRHNWHFNLLYHIPDLASGGVFAKLVNGWWVGNIVTAQSGYAFTPLLNTARSNNGLLAGQGLTGLVDRVNVGTDTVTGPGGLQFVPYDPDKVITGDPNGWFNPLLFRLPPTGQMGNAGRGMLRGPGLGTWDLSLNKDTGLPFLGESGKLQLRVGIFNILNRANFSLPSGRVFAGTVTVPAGATQAPINNVGRITTTATSSRQIQLALKVIF